jgi:hypothetical protein
MVICLLHRGVLLFLVLQVVVITRLIDGDIAFSECGTWTMSQSTDVPTGQGFAYSQKWDCTTANASPLASGSLFYLNYKY